MASRRKVVSGRRYHLQSRTMVETPLWHFFKFILPSTLEDKRLRLPKRFVRKFGEELSDFAGVVVPTGRAWEIGLTKAENCIWFDYGWQKFVEYYCIGCKYLLVFRYRGLSNFNVLIFDMNACEIQYPSSGPASGEEIDYGQNCLFVHEDKTDDADCVEIMGSPISSANCCAVKSGAFDQYMSVGEFNERHNASAEKNVGMKKCQGSVAGHDNCNFELFSDKRGKKPMKEEYLLPTDLDDANELRKGKFNKHQMSSRNGSLFNVFNETKVDRGKCETECDEGELLSKCEEHMEIVVSGLSKASQASKRAIHAARKFKPKNPSFMVLLRRYNIHNNFVYVPLGFAEKYLNQVSERIKLEVSDGREWPLRVIKRERKLSKGWNRFHKENDLKEGDVCVFELIRSKKSVLKVTIFRVDEDSESLN